MSDETDALRMLSYPEGVDSIDQRYIDSHTQIPSGSYVEGLISVISYTDGEGNHRWLCRPVCDLATTHMVGLLNSAAVQIMAITPGMITGVSPPLDDD